MQRILIIGSAGAGKSTFARQLGRILRLPVIHLDRHYWKPGWTATPDDEWDRLVERMAQGEQWIMDGNYSRTLDIRLQRADTVILLDLPTWLCLYRVVKRRIRYHNKTRPDLNEGCPEKIDGEFFQWVWNYRKRSRPKTLEKLQRAANEKRVIIVKNRKEAAELLLRFQREHTTST